MSTPAIAARFTTALAFLLLAASTVACRRGTPGAVPPAAKAPPVTKEAVVTAASTGPAGVPVPAAPPSETSLAAPTEDLAQTNQAATDAPPAEGPRYGRERILLFAPHSPLIVEFQITIDGRPHHEALEQLVDEVLALVEKDVSGRVTWKALCATRALQFGQYGNLPIDGDNGEKQIIERYDINRDGIVDRTELPRFLTRNAGGSRSFSVRGTSDYQHLNRRGAATWQCLDTDRDGTISAEERAAAATLLASRDMDDDEILVPADLNPRLAVMDPAMSNQRRRRGPDAVRLLGPHADWGSIRLSLENQYGGGRYLREDSFPLAPELFSQLDADGNGRLLRDEFSKLDELPADVVVAVDFGRQPAEDAQPPKEGDDTGDQQRAVEAEEPDSTTQGEEEAKENEDPNAAQPAASPRLRLVHVADKLATSGEAVVEQSGRLTLELAGLTLTIYTNDTVAADDFQVRAEQGLAMFDTNKDGYLEASEVPENVQGQFGRFEALDADADGKAYLGEITAYLRQQQAGLRAQIHSQASDREDLLFAVLDSNHDERLDSRELEAAAERLAALDSDGDGSLLPDELPEAMVIGLARGSIENTDALFTPPPVAARTPAGNAPRWFIAMDANRDGAISRREFLGAAEQFAQLDADGNGLVDLDEATAAGGDSGGESSP
jgi:Ca2+-binding EF-hand superfamily protein